MRSAVGSVLLLLLATSAVADLRSDDLAGRLQRELAAGDRVAALATARELVTEQPGLAGAWYNLAGLEDQVGDRDRADEAFARAVQLGFDDFRFADRDPDLAGIRPTSTYQTLRDAWQDGLRERAERRHLDLRAATWTETIALRDREGGLFPPAADARLQVDQDGIELEVLIEDETLPPLAPWQAGGSGVLVSVTLPDQGVEGTLHRDFGFGWIDKLPAGAMLLDGRWQPLAQLSPKMRVDNEQARLRLTIRIPWATCGSLHPLVDDVLLLNVAYVRGHGENPGRASLLADPGLGRPDRAWRRGVPLRVRWRDDAAAIAARLEDHVIRGDAFPLQVRATLPGPGAAGEAHLVLRDRRGQVVADRDATLDDHALATTVAAPPTAGSALLGVSLGRGPERGLASWERALVVLPSGWDARVEAAIAAAPVRERPSLRYRQRAIAAVLAGREPRAEVHALGGTVDELEAMLAALEARGTSLPAGGTYLAVAPAAAGTEPTLCSLFLPAGWTRGDAARVVLLLARAPGAAQRAVLRAEPLVRELSDGRSPTPLVLAIPHLGPTHDPEQARATARELIGWLGDLVGTDSLRLAGVDLLAATALELAADPDLPLDGVLAITGVHFAPYPELDREQIARRLGAIPPARPVGWIWFPDEILADDQSSLLRRVLRDAGHELAPAVAVPGGLSFDQAWTRTVAWVLDAN